MELKVWVEGIQRIVCGVTESTTCQDVVYALAHATAQTGRFTLVERWRTNERLLAPHENPIKVLMKWGEYTSEVQLVLRRSIPDGKRTQNFLGVHVISNTRSSGLPGSSVESPTVPFMYDHQKSTTTITELENGPEILDRNRDVRKSLTFSGFHGNVTSSNSKIHLENVAIVQPTLQSETRVFSIRTSAQKNVQPPSNILSSDGTIYQPSKKVRELPPYRDPPGPISPLRILPPYREPPPPNSAGSTRSQLQGDINSQNSLHNKDKLSSPRSASGLKRNHVQEFQESKNSSLLSCSGLGQSPNMVTVAYTERYVELIRIVNRQRDTINAQQAELTKFDAEILYWETKSREQTHQMDFISQEVNRIESTGRLIEEQLKDLAHAEEESEIVRQQEKTLKSETTLLRSKLANCETELLQCKNKIRLVMEELALEQHNTNREYDERLIVERKMIGELEHLQEEVEHTKRSADLASQCADSLKFEVSNLEEAIVEKKMQIERLVTDMKEANLLSLTVACQDDQVKHLLEGAHKPGSTRKIIGSPRQLESAVPTSKNPHGVWV